MSGERLLAGRVAAVTGAAGGIGAAVARRFAEQGATVVVVDVLGAQAAATATAIAEATGAPVVATALDVTDEAATAAAFEGWVDRFGRLDVVVANAGVLHLAPVVDLPLDTFRRVMEVNLTGAFLTMREAARRMTGQGRGGSIIATSSLFGVRGGQENGAYSASKFAVIGLVQSLAAELGAHGIRVNAVCPGQIATDMMDRLIADRTALSGLAPDAVKAGLLSRVGLGRFGTVEEVADTFVYLASDLSRYVTGQSLIVDGGYQVG